MISAVSRLLQSSGNKSVLISFKQPAGIHLQAVFFSCFQASLAGRKIPID